MADIDAAIVGANGAPGENRWTQPPLRKVAESVGSSALETSKHREEIQRTNKLLREMIAEMKALRSDLKELTETNAKKADELIAYLHGDYLEDQARVLMKALGLDEKD